MRPSIALLITTFSLLASGCGGTEPSGSLAGSYAATVFTVTPTGQSALDVLAAGGGITITIAGNNLTTGHLDIPPIANGGMAFSASMAGTATLTGSTVQFQQAADTFVRDLTWTFTGASLNVANQVVGGAVYTITLTRE